MRERKTLHLVLKHRWYDMIERYEKHVEYRRWQTWGKRICAIRRKEPKRCDGRCDGCRWLSARLEIPTDIGYLCLHRGYTNTTMTWETVNNRIAYGNTELGAPEGEKVIVFDLDRKVDPVTHEEATEDYIERMRNRFGIK